MPGLENRKVKVTLVYLDIKSKLLKYMHKYLIVQSGYNFSTANKLIFKSIIGMRDV